MHEHPSGGRHHGPAARAGRCRRGTAVPRRFRLAGLAIANGILSRFGARPWRLDAAAYRRAAAASGPRLVGRRVAAVWDAELAAAMRELDVKVEEERVIDDLLADLLACGTTADR